MKRVRNFVLIIFVCLFANIVSVEASSPTPVFGGNIQEELKEYHGICLMQTTGDGMNIKLLMQ